VITPGQDWGEPASGPPDLVVEGTDADLAAAVRAQPGALVRFVPTDDSDVARSIGLTRTSPGAWIVPMDALRVDGSFALNMLVVGARPNALHRFSPRQATRVAVDGRQVFDGPATTVLVATGQFLEGLDVVPRGHPGDGRAEVQVYALRPGERRAMRARLRTGTHLPHPHITQATGRRIEVGVPNRRVVVEVVPNAYRLLV
jgi:hypothetical protein